jgi:hypothetical protein
LILKSSLSSATIQPSSVGGTHRKTKWHFWITSWLSAQMEQSEETGNGEEFADIMEKISKNWE